MNIEEIREYNIAKPGVTEGFPFDETTPVFKVMNKMFHLNYSIRVSVVDFHMANYADKVYLRD